QSSKSAGTSFGKKSGVSVGIPTVLGKTYDRLESAAEAERDFNGSARSSQQNTLRGSIAVTVHQVLPNGTLLIKGEKALRLNQGDEYIRLVGLVRVDDIDRSNQISSQNVANARISYAGRVVLNDSNSAGWLTSFFTRPLVAQSEARAMLQRLLVACVLCWPHSTAAVPLMDLVDIEGIRGNQVIGYGLVVGLDGTGDKNQVKFTSQ